MKGLQKGITDEKKITCMDVGGMSVVCSLREKK